jgi:septum site-determining protein MinC
VNALELKGRMLSTTRVRVMEGDLAAIADQLRRMARQMPQAVQGMPVILEAADGIAVDLAALLAVVREVGMQPIGVAGEALAAAAQSVGMAVLPADAGARGGRVEKTVAEPQPAAAPAPAPTPVPASAPARVPARLVTEPVRGGQQMYVPDGDLVVMHQVAPGAEAIADGCVHIYGRLAGRAIAGARGDANARIFCRRFEPELVAIAGVYAVAEQLQGELHGKPAQVFLQDGKLRVERLD